MRANYSLKKNYVYKSPYPFFARQILKTWLNSIAPQKSFGAKFKTTLLGFVVNLFLKQVLYSKIKTSRSFHKRHNTFVHNIYLFLKRLWRNEPESVRPPERQQPAVRCSTERQQSTVQSGTQPAQCSGPGQIFIWVKTPGLQLAISGQNHA